MKNVLLLVPKESYRAQAFIKGASHLGISLTIASQDSLPMAYKMRGKAIVVSIEEPLTAVKQIRQASANSRFDAVVSIDDAGLKAAALASQELGLKHISASTTDLAQNKIAMRNRLSLANVNQPRFETFRDGESFDDKVAQVGKFPIVLKPATLSGSIGVIRANSPQEALTAIPVVRSIQTSHGCTKEFPILIEEYIDGTEHAVEAIVMSGELRILSIFDKPKPLKGPYFAETIYVTPTSLASEMKDELYDVLNEARISLGIATGPIHAEFRITTDNKIYFIEMAARSIGGTCSKAVPLAGETTIEELILAEALGIAVPEISFENQASGVFMMPVPKMGKLRTIRGADDARAVKWITGVDLTYSANMEVRPIPYDAKYLGFIFAKAPSPRLVTRALEEAFGKLEMDIS